MFTIAALLIMAVITLVTGILRKLGPATVALLVLIGLIWLVAQSPPQETVASGPRTLPNALASAASSPQVRWYRDMDSPGNDLGGRAGWIKDIASADECARICLSNSKCSGFTYNIRYSACFPKASIGHLYPSSEPAVTGIVVDRN